MTQTMASHRRSASSSHLSNKLLKTAPTSRPGVHRRGTSATALSISKLGSGPSARSQSRATATADDDLDMAASFLNFCATCERQITVPNNSILYCSESCRRKDSAKPLSASLSPTASFSTNYNHHHHSSSPYSNTHLTPVTMPASPPTSPSLSPRTIVAPMTPTRVLSSTSASVPTIRIPATFHEAKSDLDPTEWKPVLGSRTTSAASMTSTTSSLATSDAWGYLSHFHGGASAMLTRRTHRSTASLSGLEGVPTPSLTHTPSVASSVSSAASSDGHEHGHEHEHEHELEQKGLHTRIHRPLPPRHNPYFSLSHAAENGISLVVPHVAAVTVQDVESDSGSIFPASSAVWEDHASGKTGAPILMRTTPTDSV
ncbi:Uncharacterized protein PECH_008407 [Penicillium ucsense]|uniref:Life-span regulatory factor-domain-containing protein n=1 Tax=Penicillium ucsense TaxID=2839758 RepID=A0A8J8VZK8_9EURO|nr:Uncharacterized protein PECM_008217 [Penicillium ucsense]KAF7734167.1 Uncharacterized protein PECH_008407 [Penicillium ucsense]